jgi:hypothetical protein
LPQRRHRVFLRRDLRQRADYYANHPFNGTHRYVRCWAASRLITDRRRTILRRLAVKLS